MSTTFATTTNTTVTEAPARTTRARALWVAGLVSGAVAAVATTVIAAAARSADVPLAIDGEQIPLARVRSAHNDVRCCRHRAGRVVRQVGAPPAAHVRGHDRRPDARCRSCPT